MSIRTLVIASALLASVSAYAGKRTTPWQDYVPESGSDSRGSGSIGVGEDRNGRCTIWNPARPSAVGHHHGNGRGC